MAAAVGAKPPDLNAAVDPSHRFVRFSLARSAAPGSLASGLLIEFIVRLRIPESPPRTLTAANAGPVAVA
jgi:hypothetical protein